MITNLRLPLALTILHGHSWEPFVTTSRPLYWRFVEFYWFLSVFIGFIGLAGLANRPRTRPKRALNTLRTHPEHTPKTIKNQ